MFYQERILIFVTITPCALWNCEVASKRLEIWSFSGDSELRAKKEKQDVGLVKNKRIHPITDLEQAFKIMLVQTAGHLPMADNITSFLRVLAPRKRIISLKSSKIDLVVALFRRQQLKRAINFCLWLFSIFFSVWLAQRQKWMSFATGFLLGSSR